jgi:hypothetical protein
MSGNYFEGKKVYPTPEQKFRPILESFEVPRSVSTEGSEDGEGTWFCRIVAELKAAGVPKRSFNPKVNDMVLRSLLKKFDYSALQGIPDDKAGIYLFMQSSPDGMEMESPLGELSHDLDLTGTEGDKVNTIIESWTGLSDDHKRILRAPDAFCFKVNILNLIEAQWCYANLMDYLLPKIRALTQSPEFYHVHTLEKLREACNRHERSERLLVTMDKLVSIGSAYVRFKRDPRTATNHAVDKFFHDLEDYHSWYDQQLSPTYGVTVSASCAFDFLNTMVHGGNVPVDRAADSVLRQGTIEERNLLVDTATELRTHLQQQRRGQEDRGGHSILDNTLSESASPATGGFNRMKHSLEEEEQGSRKKHKNKYADPEYRAKVLPSVRRYMVKKEYTSISQLKGHYRKIVDNATQEEIDKHLSADRLKPKTDSDKSEEPTDVIKKERDTSEGL